MNESEKLRHVFEAIDFTRGLVLDAVEAELSHDLQCWFYLRNRLLKAFGDRGLEGRIKSLFAKESK
jgi:hypothetical protein